MILVPAHNEAKTIENVVKQLLFVGDKVVVIDDGSTDDTALLAGNAGATVLRHTLNRGQGAALETGHTYARQSNADFVVHFDADGQFDFRDIPRALASMKEKNVDIILGSRFLGKEQKIPWLKRAVILPFARNIDRLFGSVSLSDAHNGFRVMNQRALNFIQLTQDRMAHATEIPQLIRRYNLRYAELPISVSYHEFGQGPIGGFRIVRDLLVGKFM